MLGGQAIRLLAFDPLLPEEFCSGDERRKLTEAMLDYDEYGRRMWRKLAAAIDPPLSLVTEQAC